MTIPEADRHGEYDILLDLPPEYEDFQGIRFKCPEFNALVPDFVNFAYSEDGAILAPYIQKGNKVVRNLQRSPSETHTVMKARLLGIMLHQLNIYKPEVKNYRGHESTKTANPRPLPYAVHTERVTHAAAGMNLDTDALNAAALHDTKEDTSVRVGQKIIEKQTLIEMYKIEFADNPRTWMLVDLLSNVREELTEEDKQTIRNSRIYDISLQKYIQFFKKQGILLENLTPEKRDEIDYYIIKATNGIAHIIAKAREHAGVDDELFLRLVYEGILLKCLDGLDNSKTKGSRPPGNLRNRILIHCARIMGSPLADKLMKELIKADPDDPFNPYETLRYVDAQRRSPKTAAEVAELKYLLREMGLPGEVSTHFQVSIHDESTNNPAHQVVISTDGRRLNQLASALEKRASVIFKPKFPWTQIFVRPVTGIHHKVMTNNGRNMRMFEIMDGQVMPNGRVVGELVCYVRMNGSTIYNPADYPDSWELVKHGAPALTFDNCPEAPIFYVPPGAGLAEALEVVSSMYHPTEVDYQRMTKLAQQKRAA